MTRKHDHEVDRLSTICRAAADLALFDEPALNTPRNVARLATCIQRAVEDWLAGERFEHEEREKRG